MEIGDLQFGAQHALDPSRTEERPRSLLPGVKRVAVLGASDNAMRKSYRVVQFLAERGVDVVPVSSPADVAAVAPTADAVVVFCKPTEVMALSTDLAETPAPAVWFQEGLMDQGAARLLEEAGKMTIMDRCIMRDYRQWVMGEEVETWFPV